MCLKKTILIIFSILAIKLNAQNAEQIIDRSLKVFNQVKSYSNEVKFDFDIPNVKINAMKGKEYYKFPDKYRVKIDGIAFVPKENAMKIYKFLMEKSKYQAVYTSSESFGGQNCHIVNIIPTSEGEFILAKLWISSQNFCMYKAEFTTKNGTVRLENRFKAMIKYGLPDQMIFYIDNMKMRSKENKKSDKEKKQDDDKPGTITMSYTKYQINIPVADSLFPAPSPTKEKKKKS